MTEWITGREAAVILGVHPSVIPKMRRRGDLTSRPDGRRPAWSREQVIELRDRRAAPKPPKQPRPREEPRGPRPPDQQHEWLNSDQAAELLGLGRSGVNYRVHADKLPNELHDGRRWFRRDLLELVRRAEVASVQRRVRSRG